MLNITNYQRNANQNYNEYRVTWVRWPSTKHLQTISAGETVAKREPACTVGGNINWCSHYGEQYGDSLKKLKIELPYDPAIPLLGIYPEKIIIQKHTCTQYSLLYKKGLNGPDNYDGVITHLELDILECKVKGALRSISMNKASGGNGIPVELFQILKDDAVKVLHSICQQIWKIQQWPQEGKSQFSFQSERKAMPKNIQTIAQLLSIHILAR